MVGKYPGVVSVGADPALTGRGGAYREFTLSCSQPTLSAQIAKLEDELGLQLFERGPRTATPTVNGRAIIRQAQIVSDDVESRRRDRI
jgi:hypothetical protein